MPIRAHAQHIVTVQGIALHQNSVHSGHHAITVEDDDADPPLAFPDRLTGIREPFGVVMADVFPASPRPDSKILLDLGWSGLLLEFDLESRLLGLSATFLGPLILEPGNFPGHGPFLLWCQGDAVEDALVPIQEQEGNVLQHRVESSHVPDHTPVGLQATHRGGVFRAN